MNLEHQRRVVVMARIVKCRWCDISDTPRSNMEFEVVGKKRKSRMYYHKDCYKHFLEDKKFKEQEAKELDSLRLTIEEIFGVRQLPYQAYPFLQNLRNGEQVFGGQRTGKRYKEGYEFSLIEETFRYCEDTIHYWLNRRDFKGFMNAFKYSLAIIIDKIYFVEQRVESQKSNMRMLEQHVEQVKAEEVNTFKSSYEKRSTRTDDDILDFLD